MERLDMQKECAVVTGASGFIGTRLVKRLAESGVLVRAIDILPPRERFDGVDYITADVRQAIPVEHGQGASTIYNLAAVHRTPGHPDREYYDTNIPGALNVAALAEACDIKTIVFTSSISVYGPSEEALRETSPLKPVSAYGRSKRMAERVHEQWRAAGADRRLIVVRPGVVFGPGERGNYSHLAKALGKGYFAYPGRRDTIKSGGYVDELLGAIAFARAQAAPYILFNFAYPDLSTTEDIVRTFSQVTGRNYNPSTIPVAPLLLAARLSQTVFGPKNPIHPDRVMKLVQSTKVVPAWLVENNYQFSTKLKEALEAWRDETSGSFA